MESWPRGSLGRSVAGKGWVTTEPWRGRVRNSEVASVAVEKQMTGSSQNVGCGSLGHNKDFDLYLHVRWVAMGGF